MYYADAVHNMFTHYTSTNFHHDKWRPFMKELIGGILTEAGNDPNKLTIRVTTPHGGELDLKPWEVYHELMHNTYVTVRKGHTVSVIVGYKQEDGSIRPDLNVVYYYQDE